MDSEVKLLNVIMTYLWNYEIYSDCRYYPV